MSTHVALIRGINVGRAKRVAMKDLRDLIAGLGADEVRTVLNSGNVVFDAPAGRITAAAIEKAMAHRLGVSARVTLLTARQFAAVARANPLEKIANDPSRLLVAFLADARSAAPLAALAKQDWGPEVLATVPRAAYLWCPGGIAGGNLAEAAMRALGEGATMRNWATVLRIRALASPAPEKR